MAMDPHKAVLKPKSKNRPYKAGKPSTSGGKTPKKKKK